MIRRGDVGEEEDKSSHAPSPLVQQSQLASCAATQASCKSHQKTDTANTFCRRSWILQNVASYAIKQFKYAAAAFTLNNLVIVIHIYTVWRRLEALVSRDDLVSTSIPLAFQNVWSCPSTPTCT